MKGINIPKYHNALEEQIFEDMELVLKPYGFHRPVPAGLLSTVEKPYGFGKDYVSKTHLILMYSYRRMKIYPYPLSRKINLVEELWADLGHLVNIDSAYSNLTLYISAEFAYPEIRNESLYDSTSLRCELSLDGDDIKKFNEFSRFVMTEKILPCAMKFLDLGLLGDYILQPLLTPPEVQNLLGTSGAVFRKLIIAKLIGDSRYEQIYEYEKQFWEDYEIMGENPEYAYLKNYPKVFQILYERLKNIKPLSNLILT